MTGADDLISRSAAIALMEKDGRALGITVSNVCNFKDIIRTLPAVEAVPVVRCNMCKYYEQDTGFCQYFGGGNHWDGFCNNGARMDAEEGRAE